MLHKQEPMGCVLQTTLRYINILGLGLAIDPGRVGSGRKFRSGRFVEKVEGSKKVDFQ